jgi:hypothetical protein
MRFDQRPILQVGRFVFVRDLPYALSAATGPPCRSCRAEGLTSYRARGGQDLQGPVGLHCRCFYQATGAAGAGRADVRLPDHPAVHIQSARAPSNVQMVREHACADLLCRAVRTASGSHRGLGLPMRVGRRSLIHRVRQRVLDGTATDAGGDSSNDPFVVDEVGTARLWGCKPRARTCVLPPRRSLQDDPVKAHALESSLWELEALKRYTYPPIAQFVKVFSGDFTKPVRSLSLPRLELRSSVHSPDTPCRCRVIVERDRNTTLTISRITATRAFSPTRLGAFSSRCQWRIGWGRVSLCFQTQSLGEQAGDDSHGV